MLKWEWLAFATGYWESQVGRAAGGEVASAAPRAARGRTGTEVRLPDEVRT